MGKFNFKNEKDFNEIKEKAEKLYKTIGKVKCPYLKEKVAFNVRGLKHLKFKSDQQARIKIDQYSRLKLLHLAPQILEKSYTLQGIWRTKQFEEQKTNKTNNKWKHIMKDVVFYEFIAVLDNIRLKVIVKEVVGGEKHFWSIIPYWGINKATGKRILHGSKVEYD